MEIVSPGEIVAVEEEAIPVSSVYSSGDGYLRAMIAGIVVLDRYKKTIQIRPLSVRELLLRQGAVVEGLVLSVSEDVAITRIYSSESGRVNATGILHISQIASEYISDIYEYIKPSDVIKARVLNNSPPYLLSIKEPSTGVITAYCSNCSGLLRLHPSGYLICRNCGRQEKRKIAVGYYIHR